MRPTRPTKRSQRDPHLSAGLITALAVVWVVTYRALGLRSAAAIPLTYQLVSIINPAVFAKTKRYRFFRTCELGLSVLLPFLLQLSLGGFVPSSGVILWSFTAPLGALLILGRREAVPRFAAFIVTVAAAAVLDPIIDSRTAEIPRTINVLFFALNVLGVTGMCYVLLQYFVHERERIAAELAVERERSERLLLNVLPEPIATRLNRARTSSRMASPRSASCSPTSRASPPWQSRCRRKTSCDSSTRSFPPSTDSPRRTTLEKIKTIGDAYMVASGLLGPDPQHADNLARMALAIRNEIAARDQGPALDLRIGIDIGPVVPGVIGRSKFIYDLWGDTVKYRESDGIARRNGRHPRVRERLASSFVLEDRGEIEVKGKGRMRTYLVDRREGSDLDLNPTAHETP